MPLFRGAFLLKREELSVLFFRICAELWILFEETCRIMGNIWENVAKIAKKSKGYVKVV